MEILTSFFISSTGLTIVAIIIVLAVIGGIALLLGIVRRKHKKSFAFYLILFAVFTMLFFLSALLIDKHVLLDQGHEQIKASIKEDEADHKR